jgi:hypothetical protein
MNDTSNYCFTIDGSQKSVKEVMSRLLFISKFDENHCVDTKKLILEDDNLLTDLYRRYVSGETREKTRAFIEDTTNDALSIITECVKGDIFHHHIADMLIQSLHESKKGILSLCRSKRYKNDTMFTSKMETLIQLTDAKIENINAHRVRITP